MSLVRGGKRSARRKKVYCGNGHHSPVGNGVILSFFKTDVMRTRSVGAVNVYFVRAARNRVVELAGVYYIGSGYFVQSHDTTAFADSRFRRHVDKIGVFHAIEVVFQKSDHFKNLFARLDFRRAAVKRRHGILFENTSRVEVNKPLAAVYVAEIEQKHVFPLVFDTAFATHFRVFFVYKTHIQLAFVHARKPETKRHRLNPIVVFPSQLEFKPRKSSKVGVARGVDKEFRL